MQKSTGWLLIVGWLSLFAAAANAQTSSGFDGTYRVVSATNVNATYTDRNGRIGSMPEPKTGAAPYRERAGAIYQRDGLQA